MMSNSALLIDAKNALYRAIYAVRAPNAHYSNYHAFTVFVKHISTWMNQFRPSSVHVFWDAPRTTVWRRNILPTYKERPDNTYVENVANDLALTTKAAFDLFQVMNVRQYFRKSMESDDLIYAFVSVMHPCPTTIVSTDGDLLQVPYVYGSTKVYNPKTDTITDEITTPYNPAMLKALKGDETDIIKGYLGIGPKKGHLLLEDRAKLQEFLAQRGSDTFEQNLLLIDLSCCPELLKNRLYVQRKAVEPVRFCKDSIYQLAKEHKILGLVNEFANIVLPFKELK